MESIVIAASKKENLLSKIKLLSYHYLYVDPLAKSLKTTKA